VVGCQEGEDEFGSAGGDGVGVSAESEGMGGREGGGVVCNLTKNV